jgi:hypothetical protein
MVLLWEGMMIVLVIVKRRKGRKEIAIAWKLTQRWLEEVLWVLNQILAICLMRYEIIHFESFQILILVLTLELLALI